MKTNLFLAALLGFAPFFSEARVLPAPASLGAKPGSLKPAPGPVVGGKAFQSKPGLAQTSHCGAKCAAAGSKILTAGVISAFNDTIMKAPELAETLGEMAKELPDIYGVRREAGKTYTAEVTASSMPPRLFWPREAETSHGLPQSKEYGQGLQDGTVSREQQRAVERNCFL